MIRFFNAGIKGAARGVSSVWSSVRRGAAQNLVQRKKQAEALRDAQQLIGEQRRSLRRKDRKIKKQAQALSKVRQGRTRARRRLKQQKQTVERISWRYDLGFSDRALKDLQNLVADDSKPNLRRLAAWQLALLYASQCRRRLLSEEDARRCLEVLPIAMQDEKDLVRLRQAAVVEAECQNTLGNTEAAKRAISRILALGKPHPDLLLASANLETSALQKVEWVNKALQLHGISRISFDASADLALLDSLCSAQDQHERVKVSSDTRVSVIMPVYNAEDVIRTALDSVLSQTWTNIEVLVVDDCSSDATAAIVEDYVRRDPRVRLIEVESNGGTYVARNLALSVASGTLVTCHDADDWSHPEKIERQARYLLSDPSVIGNTSQQARVGADLRFFSRATPGSYVASSASSFMFRREPVIEAVGYWDCVRFAADGEFIERVKKVFGKEHVVLVPTGPLSFLRASNSSLTGHETFGLHGRRMGARKEYRESYTHFHDTAEDLRLEFPLDSRIFPVPEPMWPTREVKRGKRRHFDVVLVSDFRLSGGTTSSNVEEIKVQKRMGLRTGLIQLSRYGMDPSTPINPKIRELLDGDRVHMLVYGERVSCDALILKHPPILQEWQRFVPDVQAANVHVIVNQTPRRRLDDEVELEYTIGRCEEHLRQYFGKAGLWHPISPLVRDSLYQHHKDELTNITLASDDWLEIIDVDEWWRESRPPRGERIRIGRHSRDHGGKWPADPSEMLAIYPDSDDYEVHVLGGARAPGRVLGNLPKNWHVLEFGEMHPKDFLSRLDVFAYYPHPDLVEAFGRSIIEAMAAGVPVILPPRFRGLFKEAAIYAAPSDVKWNIERLMSDDSYYESQARIARDYVREHFGYTLHATRLRNLNVSGEPERKGDASYSETG